NVYYWREYRYDEVGNLLSEIAYNLGDGRYHRYEYRYDKNGKEIQDTALLDGEITGQREYEYDKWGNLKDDGVYFYVYEYATVYTSRQPEPFVIVGKKEYHDRTLVSQSEYDRAGKEIAQIVYGRNESILKQITYDYDKVGNLVEQTEKKNGSSGTRKNIYTYNEMGDRTEYAIYFGGELYIRYEYKYDKMGRETGFTGYDEDGDIFVCHKDEYEYDETGNVISDTLYILSPSDYESGSCDDAWELFQCEKYEYDEVGRKEKEILYMDDRMVLWYEWEYDGKGRIFKKTRYAGSGSILAQDKYEYDDDGKIIKKIHTEYGYYGKDGNPEEEITEYSYDASGNLIEERTKERSITYEYVYE
ncbi:MAG: hypothetical protein NC231_08435, partial [Bacillus sp. (in: Bacteria)]|nr:hypothetical protein [Bacillus sp. (in: firmicutes)]